MSKTSAAVKNRYAAKVYDRLNIVIPRGRLEDLKRYCESTGDTINGLVNELLRDRLGMDPEQWKDHPRGNTDTPTTAK